MQIPATPRLRFQLMSAPDANLLFDVDQDEQVMLYINGGQKSSWQDIEQRMVPRMNAYRNPQLGYGIYAVFATQALPSKHSVAPAPIEQLSAPDSTADGYLGWILVRPMNFFTTGAEHDNLELGWRFKRHCWGLGIASEAAAAVANSVVAQRAQLTSITPVQALSAIALPDNQASIGVMKKLGMQYVKRYIHQDPLGDYDVVLYRKMVAR